MAMASKACRLIAAVILAVIINVQAGDPDIANDFVAGHGATIDANFFTFRGLRGPIHGAPTGAPFKVTKANQVKFPALTGQSVSCSVLQFAPGSSNTPHIHPRSAEILMVLTGHLKVMLVDSTNKLYTQSLQPGDLFVIPKGLVHLQVNMNAKYPAVALSVYGSSNAGTISLPKALFGSGMPVKYLAQSFKTDVETINKLASANMG